jgi:recombination protein RecA
MTLTTKLALLRSWEKDVNTENQRKGTGLAVLHPGDILDVPRLPTGAPSLDIRLGGGIPKGAITEIFGPKGSGKSTLAYQTIAELQRRDPNAIALLVDVEGSYSGRRGTAMGIDPERSTILRPGTAERMFDAILDITGKRAGDQRIVDLVIIDSVAALITEAEDEADMGDAQVGVLARLMSKACRHLSAVAARTGTTFIFINQTRMKIGVFYGNPETTTGGEALSFYAWSRIRTAKVRDLKVGDKIVGQETKATIHKAKLDDAVGGEAVFRIMRRDGIDTVDDLIRLGLTLAIVEKSGQTYRVTTDAGEVRAVGRAAFAEAIRANPSVRDQLYDQVVTTGIKTGVDTGHDASDAADAS